MSGRDYKIKTSKYCDVCRTTYGNPFKGMLRINPITGKEVLSCPECEKKRWENILAPTAD